MTAIKLALELPEVQVIEIDVQLSSDGVPVVIHDFTLERTTNGTGLVKDHAYSELVTLDVGSWFNTKFAGEKIPTLEAVLQLVRGKCKLNIEIKTAGEMYPGIESKIIQLIGKYKMQSDVYITSFDHESVKQIKKLDASLQTGLIILGKPLLLREQLKEAGTKMIAMNYHYLTREFVSEMNEADITVLAWTVDDLTDIKAIVRLYPQVAICTNYPERVISLRDSSLFRMGNSKLNTTDQAGS